MRFVAAIGGLLFAAVVSYGAWLVATPDADGGRRPFGFMVLFFCLVVVLIGCALLLSGKRASKVR